MRMPAGWEKLGLKERDRLPIWVSIAVCLWLVGCQAPPPELPIGRVVKIERVVSGQTVEISGVVDRMEILESVRLIGLDAPDLKQDPWGPQAKQKLEQLIGKDPAILELDVEEKDRYDRRQAYLWRGNVLLNEQLVKQGYALAVPRSPNTKYQRRLAYAQEWARIMGLGIWNPDRPLRQTPSEFRKSQ